MEEHGGILARFIYPLLASLAGSITSLYFRPFKDMEKKDIYVSVFVGMSFAYFLGPWATNLIFGKGPVDYQLQGGLYYLMATGSNVFIPLAIKKFAGLLGFASVKEEERP